MFCVKCGAENPADAEFCHRCGKQLFTPQSEPSNQPVRTPDTLSNPSKPAPGHKWKDAYGWLFLLFGLYLLSTALMSLIGGHQLTPAAWPFGKAKPIGVGSALFQALLFSATGLEVIRGKKVAVPLVWATVVLSGLGVLLRGMIPLDMLLWLASVGLAIWYSKKWPRLANRGAVPVATAEPEAVSNKTGASAEPPQARSTSVPITWRDLLPLAWLCGLGVFLTLVFWLFPQLLPTKPDDVSTTPAKASVDELAKKYGFIPGLPCPSGTPAGVRVVPIKDLTGIEGTDGKLASAGFSFSLVNRTYIDRPDLHFGGYCLTALQYEVEMQSDDGSLWKGTGQESLREPLGPYMSDKFEELKPTSDSKSPRREDYSGRLISWRIIKTWGFPLNPEDRAKSAGGDEERPTPP
jgi:zinc-ribbon domain